MSSRSMKQIWAKNQLGTFSTAYQNKHLVFVFLGQKGQAKEREKFPTFTFKLQNNTGRRLCPALSWSLGKKSSALVENAENKRWTERKKRRADLLLDACICLPIRDLSSQKKKKKTNTTEKRKGKGKGKLSLFVYLCDRVSIPLLARQPKKKALSPYPQPIDYFVSIPASLQTQNCSGLSHSLDEPFRLHKKI